MYVCGRVVVAVVRSSAASRRRPTDRPTDRLTRGDEATTKQSTEVASFLASPFTATTNTTTATMMRLTHSLSLSLSLSQTHHQSLGRVVVPVAGVPQREVITQQLHDQGSVLVLLFRQVVQVLNRLRWWWWWWWSWWWSWVVLSQGKLWRNNACNIARAM